MKKTGGSVAAFIAGVAPEKRRRDAETMVALMREITGREPELWGTIIGFGSCHYRYPTGTEGDVPIAAFAARRQATTVYLLDTGAHARELAALGPHEAGAGCLYIKDLEAVDAGVLRGMIAEDYRRVIAGETGSATYTVTD
ncbi:DUF1801 domain-containing protein [Microbacterium sp. CFBP9034]|uniref:DUF1801 domain-containing protein n=1 Tax=Microbacterium sp. CFBP9034 TaxID=3096540 RepID=UPI002A6B724D|nr:DUF1801 domain-containing protein [Microbacterium sp. CFBP9034]MDY0908318.1 DUF1801 domain-containing protein [Microbacterium sp. CFBP9034]